MRIELPWPDKHLSPNVRVHWAVKAKYKTEAKDDAYVLACEAQFYAHEYFITTSLLTMSLTFCPPDKRRRDLDNIEASCKAAFDGMCAGLGIDDSQIIETSKRWGEVVKGGQVIVEISELEAK
jgi:crossover junction endodeoxyribonuclease RusA